MSYGYKQSLSVEMRGMLALMPFLEEKTKGRFTLLYGTALAKQLQETVGDVILGLPEHGPWSVEVKTEERETGNLYLESWSNRNLKNKAGYSGRGQNPGWFLKTGADLLFYYFLASDNLFVINLFALKQWAFPTDRAWRVCAYAVDGREKPQNKYDQKNDTWGWCIPIEQIRKDVGLKQFKVRQLSLLPQHEKEIFDAVMRQ